MKAKCQLAGLLTGLALASLQLIRAAPVFAADNVVKEFDAGFGPNSVGVVDAGEDTEIAGPQAIYAGDDGEIYLLDQVNSRVVGFDAKEPGTRTRSLALPENMEPTDLIVANGNIYVWDGKPISLEESDGGLTRSVSPGGAALGPDNTAQSMFGQMGSEQLPEDATGTRALTPAAGRLVGRQLIATHGKGPVSVDVTREKDEAAARLDVRQQSASTLLAKLQLKVRDKLGSVEFLNIDHQGRMFVLGENIPAVAMEGASTFVARFSPRGALEGIYELPLTPSVALSRRFVTVSPDGDVYFLRTRKGVVDVIGVGFRLIKNAKVVDVRGPAPNYAGLAKDRKGAIAAVRPLTTGAARSRETSARATIPATTWSASTAPPSSAPPGGYQPISPPPPSRRSLRGFPTHGT